MSGGDRLTAGTPAESVRKCGRAAQGWRRRSGRSFVDSAGPFRAPFLVRFPPGLSVRKDRGAGLRDDLLERPDVLLERGAPDTVEPGEVRGRLPTKPLRISTYPASSRIVSCLDSAESDSPMLSRMNPKSAHSVAASSETIDNRVGAWISRRTSA